jgi:hypothetical protein
MTRNGIKVVMTTTGSVTPGNATLSRPYRWRKIPDWKPGDMRYREDTTPSAGTVARSGERLRRLTEFARLRNEEGLNVTEAGNRLQVAFKTASTYNRECRSLGLLRGSR